MSGRTIYWDAIVGDNWPVIAAADWGALEMVLREGAAALDPGDIEQARREFHVRARMSSALQPIKDDLLAQQENSQSLRSAMLAAADLLRDFSDLTHRTRNQILDIVDRATAQIASVPKTTTDQPSSVRIRDIAATARAEVADVVATALTDPQWHRAHGEIAQLVGRQGITGNPVRSDPASAEPPEESTASVERWPAASIGGDTDHGLGQEQDDGTESSDQQPVSESATQSDRGSAESAGMSAAGVGRHHVVGALGVDAGHGGVWGDVAQSVDRQHVSGAVLPDGVAESAGMAVAGVDREHVAGTSGVGVDRKWSQAWGGIAQSDDQRDAPDAAVLPGQEPAESSSVAGIGANYDVQGQVSDSGSDHVRGEAMPDYGMMAIPGVPLMDSPQAGALRNRPVDRRDDRAAGPPDGVGAIEPPVPEGEPSSHRPSGHVDAGDPGEARRRTDPGTASEGAEMIRTAVGGAMAGAATPSFEVGGARVDGDLVLARTILGGILRAVESSWNGVGFAVSVMRHPDGVTAFVTSNEGCGWLPAGLYLPREISTPWGWQGANHAAWEGIADPARVLAEFGLIRGRGTGGHVSALASSLPIEPSLRAQVADASVAGRVRASGAMRLDIPNPGLVDRLGLIGSPRLLERLERVPAHLIGASCLELAQDAHDRVARSGAGVGDTLGAPALRERVLAALRSGRELPSGWWEDLRDIDDLLAATVLARRTDVTGVPLGELRSAA